MAKNKTGLGGSGKGRGNGKPANKPAKKPVEKQVEKQEELTEEMPASTSPVDQGAFNREPTPEAQARNAQPAISPENQKKSALELARESEAEKKRLKKEKFEKEDNCFKCTSARFKKGDTRKSKGKCYRNPPTGNGALGVAVPASHWCGEFLNKNDK